MNLIKRYTTLLLGWIIFFLALQSCANRGSGPQGGDKDTIPPILISTTPANGSTNVSTNIIVLEFNELISVNNPTQTVIFSPPQKAIPSVKAIGKKVNIVFQDTLLPNTTYTINLKKCIVDFTESNPFQDYVYSFSTGDKIDSLQISGKVIDAQTLAAKKNYTVGIYSNLSDTAFTTLKFDRFTKTNENGEFTIYGVSEGEYNLFAINDAGGAYYYQNKGTDIAFINSTVKPYDNVLLKTFKEKTISHRLKSSKRISANKLFLQFSEPQDIEPSISLIGDSITEAPLLKERTNRTDSLIYWIKDSLLYKQDSLQFSVSYLKTDSTGAHVAQTDSLYFIFKETSAAKRRKEKSTNNHVLNFKHNLNRALEVYDTINFVFDEPIKEIITDSINLSLKVDTIFEKVDYKIMFDDSLCKKKLYLLFKKELGSEYQITMDSASITSIYGKTINAFKKPIKIKKLEEYSNLYVKFNEDVANGIVQLINDKDIVIRECPVQNTEAYFEDVIPSTYYIRMFIDENGNKKWDAGNLEQKIQPEVMHYYPKKLQLRANWDVEETWPYKRIDVLKQRPEELVKKDLTAK